MGRAKNLFFCLDKQTLYADLNANSCDTNEYSPTLTRIHRAGQMDTENIQIGTDC